MDKDINILNQLQPIFNTDEKIESIAFWISESLEDGTIFINDEDECECIYINNKQLSYYFDKKTSVAADTARNMQELFSDNKDHFENQEREDLENILYALVKKYTDLSENQDIVLTIRGFDFQALDMQVFTNYYGKRAFSRAGTIMFTIKRNGEIETREENYY